jgi:hypothetical protein
MAETSSATKAKELRNIKEQFDESICNLGLEELRSSLMIDMIANFDVPPEDKYSRVNFAQMLFDNFLVSSGLLSLN